MSKRTRDNDDANERDLALRLGPAPPPPAVVLELMDMPDELLREIGERAMAGENHAKLAALTMVNKRLAAAFTPGVILGGEFMHDFDALLVDIKAWDGRTPMFDFWTRARVLRSALGKRQLSRYAAYMLPPFDRLPTAAICDDIVGPPLANVCISLPGMLPYLAYVMGDSEFAINLFGDGERPFMETSLGAFAFVMAAGGNAEPFFKMRVFQAWARVDFAACFAFALIFGLPEPQLNNEILSALTLRFKVGIPPLNAAKLLHLPLLPGNDHETLRELKNYGWHLPIYSIQSPYDDPLGYPLNDARPSTWYFDKKATQTFREMIAVYAANRPSLREIGWDATVFAILDTSV